MQSGSPFIVAEMSANHLGSLDRAHAIVDAAADAGADAIKLQTWSPDMMCIDLAYELTSGPWAGRALVDLYREAWTPWDWHAPLFEHARARGLVPFSAAFDRASVDFLETLGVDRHKVASFELVDLPLIRYMASKGKPMILSTGMATLDEISAAVDAAVACRRPQEDRRITLLRCTSAYPSDPADAGLAGLPALRECMDANIGLSDHSLGIGVAVAAAARGATYIEKHLTLARADGGPDAGFSMEPTEFKQLVVECRRAAAAIGEVKYGPGPNESTALRRSLYLIEDVACWQPLSPANLGTARPALGLPPSMYDSLIGRKLKHSYKAGTPLTEEMLS